MKQLLSFLCSFMVGMTFVSHAAEPTAPHSIHWLSNYEEAVNLSKSTSKPLVLFFTGSDWCGWCKKLEQESLDSSEFVQAAADKFIFVKLDFPVNTTLPLQLAAQNKQLQKKYSVRTFPTLIILDAHQTQIGVTGYRPGGGRAYADHLSKIIEDHSSYQRKIQSMDKQKYTSNQLKKLYETAQAFGYDNDINHIIKVGMSSDDKQFFMIERYRLIANEGLLGTQEALNLKEQLTALDPKNKKMTHYQLALIDFEANCESSDKDKLTPERTAASLIDYIEKFGAKDKEHLWTLQMIISQVYFDKNYLHEALEFAESSYTSAPPSAKIEISMAIKNIKSQIANRETALNH